MRQSGYSVKITCFIEASPTDMDQMRLAISAIDAACEALRQDGFQMVKHETRFMLSREVGEEPLDAGSQDIVTQEAIKAVERQGRLEDMPPIPAALDRRKA